MEVAKPFNNKKTLNHDFFLNERHFINYCLKICANQNIKEPFITIKNLDHFAWSLAHETVFKRSWVKPPYAILMGALKKDNPKEDLIFLFGVFLKELIDLRYGNKQLSECTLIIANEFYEGSNYDVRYGSWGFSTSMLKVLQFTQNKCGVYKLFDRDKNLIYIGKSYTLNVRLASSIKEQQAYFLKYMITDTQADANLLEQFFISEERPKNNNMGLTFDKLTVEVKHKYKFGVMIKIYKDR